MDLKIIEHAKQHSINHIYLGAINLEAPELKHKTKFSGSEVFNRETKKWIPIDRNATNLDHIP